MSTRRKTWPLATLLLLALLVRLYNLSYHSLWFDETMSLFWAARPAGEIWRVGLHLVQDKHPPLYYLMLHGWTGLFGLSDGAVRSLGALIGALAIWPVYGIGRRLGGPRAGAIAGLLLALNPFLIWYSQEARMFMPATTFGLFGLWGLLRLWDNLEKGPEAGQRTFSLQTGLSLAFLVSGFSVALYSYLYSAFMLPVAGIWALLLGWLNRQKPGAARRFWLSIAGLAVVALLFLPLAWAAWQVSGAEAVPGKAFAGLLPRLFDLLKVYLIGSVRWPAPRERVIALAALALILAGWLWRPTNASRIHDPAAAHADTGEARVRPEQVNYAHRGGLLLLLWPGLIILVGGLLLCRDGRVFAETRYQIALVPALILALGRGLAWLWTRWRPAGLIGLALALGLTLAALPADWSPDNRREPWRESAAYVAQQAGANDAVLVYIDYMHVAFDHYFAGNPQPVFFPLTAAIDDPAHLDETLSGLVGAGFDAVWLVQSHHQDLDPQDQIAGWFGARYPLISEQYPPGIAIRGFATRYRRPAADFAGQPGLASFDSLQLLRCEYDPGPTSARDDLFHPPSNWIHVTTYWTTTAAGQPDLQPTIRLVDDLGQVWGDKLERASDAMHIWPTSRWEPGEAVRADFDVNLNPITPPGSYRLVVGLPDLGGEATCGAVEIE